MRNAGFFRNLDIAKRHQLFHFGSSRSPISLMTTFVEPHSASTFFTGEAVQPIPELVIIAKNHLHENANVSQFIDVGIEFLTLTGTGLDDHRVSRCVERINADVVDVYIKEQLLLCAVENFSRVHSASKTSLFRESILPHTNKVFASHPHLQSDAVIWADNYIRALDNRSVDCASGEKVGSRLESHLNKLVSSTSASPTWFNNVETARLDLLRTLRNRVVRILLEL